MVNNGISLTILAQELCCTVGQWPNQSWCLKAFMGRRAIKKETKNKRGTYSDWNSAARTVKRSELDTTASICGVTRQTIGGVISDAVLTNQYDDGATGRTSESVHGGKYTEYTE